MSTTAQRERPAMRQGVRARLIAMVVVGVSLGGLAFLRGTAHADQHFHHSLLSHHADGSKSKHLDGTHRHLGFHHPDRFQDSHGKHAGFQESTTHSSRISDGSEEVNDAEYEEEEQSGSADSDSGNSSSSNSKESSSSGAAGKEGTEEDGSEDSGTESDQDKGSTVRVDKDTKQSVHEAKGEKDNIHSKGKDEKSVVRGKQSDLHSKGDKSGAKGTTDEVNGSEGDTPSAAEIAFNTVQQMSEEAVKHKQEAEEFMDPNMRGKHSSDDGEGTEEGEDESEGFKELEEVSTDAETPTEAPVNSDEAEKKRLKHEERKKKRQLDAAASALTIAESKVNSITSHLNNKGKVQVKNGQYKLTGSGALGDKAARLKAAKQIAATKVASVEELNTLLEKFESELVPYGFAKSNENSMGPADLGTAEDDESDCKGKCGVHGYCAEGACVCVSLYKGEFCSEPAQMPNDMHSAFNGNYIFNRKRLGDLEDLTIRYTTNPKAGGGGTHSLAIPVTEDMIKLTPAIDPLGERIYQRCAVIGSSGVMNHYEFGKDIDSANSVIRFNLAPTNGEYTRQVGSRTTWRFVNTVHAGFREGDEIGIMQMQSQVGLQLYLKFRREHPKERILAFDPDFSKFVSSNVRTLPTGGYFAVWLAMSRCSQVDLYGFNFASGFGVPHHYFNAEKPRKGDKAIHDYTLEHALIVKLASAGFLNFSEPCVAGCTSKTGIHYKSLAPGGGCQCNTGNPLPVALPGFCRHPGTFMCFIKCPGGKKQCPGGMHLKADKSKPADGEKGDCPEEVLQGQVGHFEDPQGKPVRKQCATWEDVEK